MKRLFLLIAAGLPALAGLCAAAPPEITLTTPAEIRGSAAIISGTAVDTEESTGGNNGIVIGQGGVREVYYQYEGESKWRKALLTARGELETTWIAEVNLKYNKPRRIYFYAVDRAGNDGPVLGRRFTRVKGSGGGGTANNPPVLQVTNRSSAIGAVVNESIIATDADGDALTYSATGLPEGLAIAPSTGRVTGTVAEQPLGAKTVTVTVTDGRGGTDTKSFTWTVTNAQGNAAPVITPVANRTLTAGQQVTDLQIEATDPDTPLSYAANGLPPGLNIDPATGLITGTAPTLVVNQDYTVTVFVTDSKNASSSVSFTISVIAIN